ncbi:MAG: hypothetical protein HC889_10705 [Synechococcaceae cyanobacterium SM1_2_3]|nr:hypothetical protein [Synechococcaceae cyanobacterium SM1_2_3]
MHFDSTDSTSINASISQLLDGLKTAFITSLAGTGSTILFKVLTTTWIIAPPKKEDEAVANAGPEEILSALLDQNQILKALKTAISSSEETSLVGQLKLLRTDENDRHRETMDALADNRETLKRFTGQLWQYLDPFAATLREIKVAIADVGETSLSSHLQRLQADHHDHHHALMQAVAALRTVIAGTEDTSLINEWRGLRSEAQNRHADLMGVIGEDREARNQFAAKLWQELDEFAEMLSKSATEQMMNALREVIADFNKNLTEQFGDNFKALDASVHKLVEWQERYRQQLEQMIAHYEQGVQAITQIETSVRHIAKESQQIPATMAQLKTVLVVNQHQLQELSRHLEAFSAMRDKAVEAVPQIREQIDQTVSAVAASVQTASEHYTRLTEQFGDLSKTLTTTSDQMQRDTRAALNEVHDHTQDLVNTLAEQTKGLTTTLKTAGEQVQRDTRATQEQVAESIQQMQKRLEGVLEEVAAAQTRAVSRAVEGVLEEMRKAVSTTGEGVNNQLAAIDQAMQQEISRVMNEMGRALAQIAGQFTTDYQKLVQAMQQIVTESGRSSR